MKALFLWFTLLKIATRNSAITGKAQDTSSKSAQFTTKIIKLLLSKPLWSMGNFSTGRISKSCLNDSAASNHMTSSANLLKNLCPYHDSAHIQVANGNSKAITVVGDITPIFNNVSECHGFYDNLLSVAQLVDNNCDVNFSCDGGCVQNQVSEAMIAKVPKVGFCFCCIPLIQIILLQLLLLSIKMKCGTDDWDIPILPFCLIIKPLY